MPYKTVNPQTALEHLDNVDQLSVVHVVQPAERAAPASEDGESAE